MNILPGMVRPTTLTGILMNFIIIHSPLVLKDTMRDMMMLRNNLVDLIVLTKMVLMNPISTQNMSLVSVDVDLIVGDVTRDRNRTMINVSVSVKKQ